jgi:hypothetical protein
MNLHPLPAAKRKASEKAAVMVVVTVRQQAEVTRVRTLAPAAV